MTETPYTSLILGSAAVGALVSSVITLVGQHIERKARREELLLSEAIKLAMAHKEFMSDFAKSTGQTVTVPDHARLAQVYFIGLRSLIGTGKLPKGMYRTDSPIDQQAFQESHSE